MDKDKLRELIQMVDRKLTVTEDKGLARPVVTPPTDVAIQRYLAEKGLEVSPQTVSRYRGAIRTEDAPEALRRARTEKIAQGRHRGGRLAANESGGAPWLPGEEEYVRGLLENNPRFVNKTWQLAFGLKEDR